MADLGEDFRRQNMGTFYVSTKKGHPVDTVYMELSEMFGEGVFPTDVYSQADMLQTISENLNAWKPRYGNPYEYYMNEVREYYAQEILDSMFSADIRQTAPTYVQQYHPASDDEQSERDGNTGHRRYEADGADGKRG